MPWSLRSKTVAPTATHCKSKSALQSGDVQIRTSFLPANGGQAQSHDKSLAIRVSGKLQPLFTELTWVSLYQTGSEQWPETDLTRPLAFFHATGPRLPRLLLPRLGLLVNQTWEPKRNHSRMLSCQSFPSAMLPFMSSNLDTFAAFGLLIWLFFYLERQSMKLPDRHATYSHLSGAKLGCLEFSNMDQLKQE